MWIKYIRTMAVSDHRIRIVFVIIAIVIGHSVSSYHYPNRFITRCAVTILIAIYNDRISRSIVFTPVDHTVGTEDLVTFVATGFEEFVIYIYGQQITSNFTVHDRIRTWFSTMCCCIFREANLVIVNQIHRNSLLTAVRGLIAFIIRSTKPASDGSCTTIQINSRFELFPGCSTIIKCIRCTKHVLQVIDILRIKYSGKSIAIYIGIFRSYTVWPEFVFNQNLQPADIAVARGIPYTQFNRYKISYVTAVERNK